MKRVVAALILGLVGACSPPASEAPTPMEAGPHEAQAPPEVLAALNATLPGFTVESSIADNSTGAQGFHVFGMSGGQMYEVQLMHANEGWRIVSTKRDIGWPDVPASVHAALASSPAPFEPSRVVEVREPGADGVMYDIYPPATGEAPITIRVVDGQAAIMPAPH